MDEKPLRIPQKPFRATPQVLVIVLITMMAMAVPIAGVAWMVKGYLLARQAPPAPSVPVNTRPLESALENVAEAQLGGDRVRLAAESEVSVRVPADQIAARAARIQELAREAGGSALEMPAAAPDAKRLVIQVPVARRELLARAIRGEKIDFAAIPAGNKTQVLEVTVEKP